MSSLYYLFRIFLLLYSESERELKPFMDHDILLMFLYCTTFTKLAVVFYYAISHELVTGMDKKLKLLFREGKCTTLLIITPRFGHALKKITSDNLDINYRYVP